MAAYIQEKSPENPQEKTAGAAKRSKPVTMPLLQALRDKGEKLTMLTCYDASFASLMDACGVEMLLIGDSLGMVCQGHDSTLPVTLDEMAYHTACVARGNKTAMVITDMPFGTYTTPEKACQNATKLIQAGAHMVKIEGGAWLAETIRYLHERAIPVCAHLGLTPQSVHLMGGYKVQGKSPDAAQRLMTDALALEHAGACMVVLEAIPATLGKEVTQALHMPTIGIGAGVDCSGQVLVMHDMLGTFPGHKARFVRNFMEGADSIASALRGYVSAVKDGSFPAEEHNF
ncbi:MAG: panB [Collimonas fungivorans]|jgi:3-methyl-2-oxobutanoate hydroxymethyltransferase|nr:panB [Collimonas fungivorans]